MPFTPEFYRETWPNGFAFAKLIIPALRDFMTIDSVIDIGCGAGGFLKWCFENDIDVRGIEVKNVEDVAVIPAHLISNIDMSFPLRINRQWDACVSLEVAEHLAEDRADIFIDNLCRMANVIIFSAARVGQPGEGHINCQDKPYWIAKFSENEFSPLAGMSELLRGNVDIPTYYRENCMIFIKNV